MNSISGIILSHETKSISEAATGGGLYKKAGTLLKRDSNAGVFLWILWIFKNTYFEEHLWITASGIYEYNSAFEEDSKTQRLNQDSCKAFQRWRALQQ